MSRPREFHHEQERPWSCVAACVRIIRSWWGEAVAEAAILAEFGDPVTAFNNAACLGRALGWDPGDPRAITQLRAELGSTWLVVSMFPGPLTTCVRRRVPVPVSRHGPLIPYEDLRGAFGLPHAVVLVEAIEPEGVLYLDPYYPEDGQPFALTDDELAEAWTGQVVIPRGSGGSRR